MKTVKKKWTRNGLAILSLVVGLTSAVTVLAGEGGMDSGGGNIQEVRKVRIQTLLHYLKSDLLYFLKTVTPQGIDNTESANLYEELLSRGLYETIQSSTYRIQEVCRDSQGRAQAAIAEIGRSGSPICISLPTLVESGATEREIYSLVIHEHAHQLGVREEDLAYRYGEALSGYVAAHLFYKPQAGRRVVIVPNDPDNNKRSEKCLDMRVAFEYWQSLPKNTPVWEQPSDIQIHGEKISDWYYSYIALSYLYSKEERVEDFLGRSSGKKIYQIGCEKLLMPGSPNNEYFEFHIIDYSPTHLTMVSKDRGQDTFEPLSQTIRMQEGERGSVIEVEQKGLRLGGALRCKGEDRETETHDVEVRLQVQIGRKRPEWSTVNTRILELAQRALNGIMATPQECRPSGFVEQEGSPSSESLDH